MEKMPRIGFDESKLAQKITSVRDNLGNKLGVSLHFILHWFSLFAATSRVSNGLYCSMRQAVAECAIAGLCQDPDIIEYCIPYPDTTDD